MADLALARHAAPLTPAARKGADQPTIQAGRFTLRPLRVSDAGLIAHYTADRRLAEGTWAIPHPLPPGAAQGYVERAMDAGLSLIHI